MLVLDCPGRIVFHAKLARQFKRGNIVFALRQKINGQEPCRQRDLGLVKDRACFERGLRPGTPSIGKAAA